MRSKSFQIAWIITILITASMACSIVSGITNQIDEKKATVQSVATEVQSGRELLGTAQSVVTQVGGSGMVSTLEALATQADESGLAGTAQAMFTQEGPAFLETAKAFATDQGPGLVETIQAAATEEGPALIETAQALATQAAAGTGEMPDNIPLVSGDRNNFLSTKDLVSYSTPMAYQDVLSFYKEQMPASGWQFVESNSYETTDNAILIYDQDSRSASVTLTANPSGGGAFVVIAITPK